MEPAKSLDEVLDSEQLQTMRAGTPEKKRDFLASLPADKLEDVLIAMPRGQRQQLFNFASTEIRRKVLLMNAPQQVVAYDLLESKLLRAIESKRQLAEELDDFWFNHFNVYYDKGSDRFLIPAYERDAIRPNVLGKFRDMLEATAKSPAMLFYLDNFQYKGEKVVLGHVIPAGGGQDDAEKVLDILATHPSTAHFISKKLAQRFVADNPPDSLVDKMAQTFLSSNGDIREVMRVMLASKEFWSEGAYRAKVKTPFEMVASSVRALDATVSDAFALANQVGNLGEPLYRKQEPTGYSNMNSDWVNSAALLSRMNFALNLAQNRVPGVKVDVSQFGSDPIEVARILMFRSASPQTRAAIQRALEDQKQKTPATVAGLVIGSPDFQRR